MDEKQDVRNKQTYVTVLWFNWKFQSLFVNYLNLA